MDGKKIKTIFIHHSTGANLINQGNIRKNLQREGSNIQFWDHGYSYSPLIDRLYSFFYPHIAGLSDFNGNQTGIDYHINITNTDPQGYEDLFKQSPTNHALDQILTYEVIIFKSCFPVTKITSDKKLEKYKQNYASIRKTIDKLPDKLFILFTPPPLRSSMTKPDYANRARIYSQWMKSNEYIQQRKNVVVFDFFDLLANKENVLKSDYCHFLPFDSHPNKQTNEKIGPIFVDFLIKTTQGFFNQM